MKHYVLGLVFNGDHSKVLLIEKLRPAWMKGRWNGIGGKIEDGEDPNDAMRRECNEETGVDRDFEHKITFTCPGGTVFVYTATDQGSSIRYFQEEDEILKVWGIYALPLAIMGNLKWIIPLCLSSVQFPVMINQTHNGVQD